MSWGALAEKAAALGSLAPLLPRQGTLALAEVVPRHTQRLSALLSEKLDEAWRDRWQSAEAALYTHDADPRFNWQSPDLVVLIEAAGFTVDWTETVQTSEMWVGKGLCDRWFNVANPTSYRNQLAAQLPEADLTTLEKRIRQELQNKTVPWQTTVLFLTAQKSI